MAVTRSELRRHLVTARAFVRDHVCDHILDHVVGEEYGSILEGVSAARKPEHASRVGLHVQAHRFLPQISEHHAEETRGQGGVLNEELKAPIKSWRATRRCPRGETRSYPRFETSGTFA